MAQGFIEVLDEDYLHYRLRSVAYLGEHLLAAGIQIVEPPGGHAIYIDAAAFCPHIPPDAVPRPGAGLLRSIATPASAPSRSAASCSASVDPDTGESARPPMELVRLAIPRRVYTQSHIDYMIEATIEVFQNRETHERTADRRGAAGFETLHGEI